MKAIETLLALTRAGTPWALARFNDGEMKGIRRKGVTIARGCQVVDATLKQCLEQALRYRAGNYWVGLPCLRCWPHQRHVADNYVPEYYPHRTLAVVQSNRNLHRWKEEFPVVAKGRKVVWVSGSDQVLDGLPFNIIEHKQLKTKDAWSQGEAQLGPTMTWPAGTIVICSCGPTATVMAHRWFAARPDLTVIDQGSTWDPETRGVSHKCHTGDLKPCHLCN